MIKANKSYPKFNVELITEDSKYLMTYDTKENVSSGDLDENIISFSIKNSMEDDSPVFSLVVLAENKWDKFIGSNDLIRISVDPDVSKNAPENPYVMVGLVSDIFKEGEYDKGSLLYRITGRAMSKALIDFEVGVIQEVSVIIPEVGWLPDNEKDGIEFSGQTAAEIGNDLMEDFVYEYAEYKFDKDKTLEDFLVHDFSSWSQYESLSDVTPFINYEGSMRQFLEDVSAKPFNELFFRYNKSGQCEAVMRPTPFDPSKWNNLHKNIISSDNVVKESLGKSDSEMYSVYVVQAPNLIDLNSMDLGVFPKYHPSLVKKYGYKRMDAQNRYLMDSQLGVDTEDGERDNNTGGTGGRVAPAYEDVLQYIEENNLNDAERLRRHQKDVILDLMEGFPQMNEQLATYVIVGIQEGKLTREGYEESTEVTGTEEDRKVNKKKNASGEKLEKFTNKLFNWYCENANFYSGDIRVEGHPDYEVGTILIYKDFEQKTTWEFYIESIQHEFSFTNGYTTILGVTRGLPDSGKKRFNNLWGKAKDFKGGYLGEPNLEELREKAKKAHSDTDSDWEPRGFGAGEISNEYGKVTAQRAIDLTSRDSIYILGAGRSGSNPFDTNGVIEVDCSSFVWWIYKEAGVSLDGGKTGMTTDTIASDSRLATISSRGSSNKSARQKLKIGDLVYFDTYKVDGHIGIYIGSGEFVGAQSDSAISKQDMNYSDWIRTFNGHVERFTG